MPATGRSPHTDYRIGDSLVIQETDFFSGDPHRLPESARRAAGIY